MSRIRKGVRVRWTSSFLQKEGRVVAVVPAGEPPPMAELAKELGALAMRTPGVHPRTATSYVVLVGSGDRRKPVLYWPRSSALEVVA